MTAQLVRVWAFLEGISIHPHSDIPGWVQKRFWETYPLTPAVRPGRCGMCTPGWVCADRADWDRVDEIAAVVSPHVRRGCDGSFCTYCTKARKVAIDLWFLLRVHR